MWICQYISTGRRNIVRLKEKWTDQQPWRQNKREWLKQLFLKMFDPFRNKFWVMIIRKSRAEHQDSEPLTSVLYNSSSSSSPGATQPIVGVYIIALYRALASSHTRLLDHTQRRATVGRTPLNEWSVRRGDLYLTTHNTHNRKTSMPRVGFEPTIAAGQRP